MTKYPSYAFNIKFKMDRPLWVFINPQDGYYEPISSQEAKEYRAKGFVVKRVSSLDYTRHNRAVSESIAEQQQGY